MTGSSKKTTLTVSQATKDRLEGRKIHRRQPYDEIIRDLLSTVEMAEDTHHE